MRMMTFAAACSAVAVLVTNAQAQNLGKAINTGGEKGAYHTTFCPPLPGVLSNAYFQGYSCTTSKGTPDNIDRVMKNPSAIGFVQLDVYAAMAAKSPDVAKNTVVIRKDIASEGLFMLTKNPDLKNFGDVLGLVRRIPFILPPVGSGPDASFSYLQSIDPDGLGRVPEANKRRAADATKMIEAVAESSDGAVGFFVQFADPENGNIKLMLEKGLTVIPVVSKEILRAKLGEEQLYQLTSFTIKTTGVGIFGKPVTVETAATPVAIITGSPAMFTDKNAVDDQKDLITKVRNVNAEKLLPQEGRLASLVKSFKVISGKTAEEVTAAIDAARQKMEKKS